jgi:hypothetical protein
MENSAVLGERFGSRAQLPHGGVPRPETNLNFIELLLRRGREEGRFRGEPLADRGGASREKGGNCFTCRFFSVSDRWRSRSRRRCRREQEQRSQCEDLHDCRMSHDHSLTCIE